MSFHLGFLSLLFLALSHLLARRVNRLGWVWQGRALSLAAGICFAYVFVALLPSLSHPYLVEGIPQCLEHYSFVIALLGFLFYYKLQSDRDAGKRDRFWLRISGYMLFNLFMGASLTSCRNPEIQPLIPFTVAMGMYYLVRDYNATIDDDIHYRRARTWLLLALFVGYFGASQFDIPPQAITFMLAFISGGVLLNAFHYELPKRQSFEILFFFFGALAYTGLLIWLRQ